MKLLIRPFSNNDLAAIVQLSVLAWEPVFHSFQQVLGPAIFPLIYPDWPTIQKEAVASVCQEGEKYTILVAEVDGNVAGFLAYELNHKDKTGEVYMLAVHPDYQKRGIGTTLNELALEKMQESGMKLAVVGTGGDPGHAPARRSYEKVGYTALPLVRYYKDL
ncbi:MAG: GNAT family N-acetyltransferase [Chloroflexi bacterium]|nr:GNAT family N-acetyltransferase [Chloroflexota bacterium]